MFGRTQRRSDVLSQRFFASKSAPLRAFAALWRWTRAWRVQLRLEIKRRLR